MCLCMYLQAARDFDHYSNQLVYAERDPVFSFIIRHYNWTVGVECDVPKNKTTPGEKT